MLSFFILLFEFCIKALLKGFVKSDLEEILDILFIICFSFCFIVDIRKNKKTRSFSFSLTSGYFFRVFLLFWDIYGRKIFILPHSGLDSEGFYKRSVIVMNSGFLKGKAFPNLMGTIFSVIGSSRLYGQFLIVLFSIASLTIFSIILYDLEIDVKTKKIAISTVCFLPNLAILSSVFLRESFISMCLTVSFYSFFKWFNGKNAHYIMIAFLLAFFASIFHSGSIAIVVGYIAIVMLYDKKRKAFKVSAKNIIPTALLLFIMIFLYTNYSELLFGRMTKVENISDIAEETVRGDTSYVQYVGNSNNVVNMIIFTIPRIFFFISSPLPFQWRGLSDIIAFCFSSMYYILILCLFISYFKSENQKNKNQVIALSIVIFSIFFVFGWGVANAGTACRHRDKIAVICGVLFALVLDHKIRPISHNQKELAD